MTIFPFLIQISNEKMPNFWFEKCIFEQKIVKFCQKLFSKNLENLQNKPLPGAASLTLRGPGKGACRSRRCIVQRRQARWLRKGNEKRCVEEKKGEVCVESNISWTLFNCSRIDLVKWNWTMADLSEFSLRSLPRRSAMVVIACSHAFMVHSVLYVS